MYKEKHLQRYNGKVASIHFRRKVLEAQIVTDYKNEYGRLKGVLYANHNLPGPGLDLITAETKALKEAVEGACCQPE